MSNFQLYDYQQDLVDRARQSYIEGYKAPCIVLGCGGGKSVIIAEVIKQTTDRKKHVLFLVHRTELRDQIRNTLTQHGVDMDYVELGMVMTVVRRLEKTKQPDLIVVDENHHVLAKSYKKILEHFDTNVLGFTATPIRLNGDGLGDINDVLLEGPSVEWLINHHRLSPYKYYTVDLTDHAALKKTSTGDYSNKSMNDALGDVIYGDVIDTYRKLANGKKAILYAHNVEYSKRFADAFNEVGIPSTHIDGNTSKEIRQQAIDDFRDGNINVLCNVDILGEGFDVPDCEVVIMVRPTESLSLYIQQSMRPMRYQKDKTAIIIDHVGNVYRHGFPDTERTWTLEKKERKKRKEVEPYPIHTCDNCLMTYQKDDLVISIQIIKDEEVRISRCPYCGFKQAIENITQKEIIEESEIKQMEREELEREYLKRKDWKTARSYKELLSIAKARGYKPSWAAFKANELGLSDTPHWVKGWIKENNSTQSQSKKPFDLSYLF